MKFIGILFVLLAVAKVVGMIVVLSGTGDPREVYWFIMQTVYAATFGTVGFFMIRAKSRDKKTD